MQLCAALDLRFICIKALFVFLFQSVIGYRSNLQGMHIYRCLLAVKPLGKGPIRKRLKKCSISRLTSQVVGLARGHLSPVAPVQLQAYLANGNSRANGQHPYNTTHRISNVYSTRTSIRNLYDMHHKHTYKFCTKHVL
jgi:hypothetical protein